MKTIAIACALLIAGTTASMAEKKWTKIGDGPSFDVAEAQCNLMAMNAEQGLMAFGSPGFVLGASIGNAIGNAIRMEQVRKNCMTIQGWKRVEVAPAKVKIDRKTGKRTVASGGGEICQRRPSLCGSKRSGIGFIDNSM